jgi:hypothetical protein
MAAVLNLCTGAILLDHGCIQYAGDANTTLGIYNEIILGNRDIGGLKSDYIESFKIIPDVCTLGQSLLIKMKLKNFFSIQNGQIGLAFYNSEGQKVFTYTSLMSNNFRSKVHNGQKEFAVEIYNMRLIPGRYFIELSVVQPNVALLEQLSAVASFVVTQSDYYGTGRELTSRDGYFFVDGSWS